MLSRQHQQESTEITSGTVDYRLHATWRPDDQILLELSFSARDWKQGGWLDTRVPVAGSSESGYFVNVNILRYFGEEESQWSEGYDYSGTYWSLSLSLLKDDRVIACQVTCPGELPQQGRVISYNIDVSGVFQRSYEFQIVPMAEYPIAMGQ